MTQTAHILSSFISRAAFPLMRPRYRYDNGAKWVQNLIIFACFQPILVFFPLICVWNIEYLYR